MRYALLVGLLLCAVVVASEAPKCVNGLVYPDRNECECFTCWEGDACNDVTPGCLLSCETNEGYVQTDYWVNVASGEPETDIAASYRTDYMDPQVWHPTDPEPKGVFGALKEQIFRVHRMVGNVKDLERKSLVVAHGATQLMNAAFHAYVAMSGSNDVSVVCAVPYYYLVPGVAGVSAGVQSFITSDESGGRSFNELIEVVTSPRNPDGYVNLTASTGAKWLVHDNVFNWPSFTSNITAESVPISLYSLSKVVGLSGSRLGWAFVEDAEVANRMGDYIYYSTHGITVDAQYRAARVLQSVADDHGFVFSYVSETLRKRWNWVYEAFAKQAVPRFAVAGEFGFSVLWIRCIGVDAEGACGHMFSLGGMLVRDGVEFGMPGYARMNMMVHDVTWEQVKERLQALIDTPTSRMARMIELAETATPFIPRYSS